MLAPPEPTFLQGMSQMASKQTELVPCIYIYIFELDRSRAGPGACASVAAPTSPAPRPPRATRGSVASRRDSCALGALGLALGLAARPRLEVAPGCRPVGPPFRPLGSSTRAPPGQ